MFVSYCQTFHNQMTIDNLTNVKSGSQVPVEVPEVHVVELLTEVPKPQYEQIPKEIPMWLGTKIGL